MAILALGLVLKSLAADAAGYWTRTGSMTTPRFRPVLTLLDNGSVLASGGNLVTASSSEIYDPKTGTWGQVAPMIADHNQAPVAVTRLQDGRYLLAGSDYQAVTEIYDPKTNSWSLGPSFVEPFGNFVRMVTLQDGRVVAFGNMGNVMGLPPNIEILDAVAQQWTQSTTTAFTSTMGSGNPYAAVLADGRAVFFSVAYGGSAAIFDPLSNEWAALGTPFPGGDAHINVDISPAAGVLLSDGTILSAGSCDGVPVSLNLTKACAVSQILDPDSGQWTLTDALPTGLDGGVMTPLANGDVIVTGGTLEDYFIGVHGSLPIEFIVATNVTERWNHSTHTWAYAPHMPGARQGHAAVRLANGNVLIAGGMTTSLDFLPGVFLSTAAVYHP